ncbi:MAG: DUF4350 domain-containing protein [Bacteroidota bacterium]
MIRRCGYWCLLALGALSLQHCGLNWSESYEIDGKQPYDLYVLHQLLEARPQGMTTVEDSLSLLREAEGSNYVFFGSFAYYNEQAITDLLDFVERGNTAFIAAYEPPPELATHLFGEDCYFKDADQQFGYYPDENYLSVDTAYLHLRVTESSYALPHLYNFKPYYRTTYFIPEEYLCDPELNSEFIGTVDVTSNNFARLPWGNGYFYLHTDPLYFTNYFLVDSLHYGYAADALSVLNDGPVFWDEVNRVPPSVARQRRQQQAGNNYSGGRNLLRGNEALRYIQEQPELALAWYLLIAATLLYVLFRGKRRQQIIPRIHQRGNSSKRFIDTLSRLVYQKGNHMALARQEMGSLRYHLKERFGVRWKEGEAPPENLAELVGAEAAVAQRAIFEIRMIQKKEGLTAMELARFYRAIAPLYKL